MIITGVLAFAALPPRADAQDAYDLDRDPGWLPYELRELEVSEFWGGQGGGWITRGMYEDLDGDGVADWIHVNTYGVNARLVKATGLWEIWQQNPPLEFTRQQPVASIDGVWDVSGAGRPSVVATSSTVDRFRWRTMVVDAITGEVTHAFEMPGGRDIRGDGSWDGHRRVFGMIDVPSASGMRRAMVIGSEAGFDLGPRGFYAVDPQSGEILWEFLTGPSPQISTVHIIDLDADGSMEVLFIGRGVNNLGGVLVNGTSDDKAVLFVLAADGTLVWSRVLGAAPAVGALEVADLDGNGLMELVVAAHLTELGGEGIAVLSHDGDLRTMARTDNRIVDLALSPRDGSSVLAYVSFSGTVRKYRISRTSITQEANIRSAEYLRVALVSDLVDDPGIEVLVSGRGGRLWLLNEDLEILAMSRDTSVNPRMVSTKSVRASGGEMIVVSSGLQDDPAALIDVAKVSRPFPWLAVVGTAGIGSTVLLGWRLRRRARSSGTLRELKLQLLARLKLAGHGKIGALSSLRRFNWHLEAVSQGFSPDDRLMRRFRKLGRDVLDNGIPDLHAALELAETAEMDRAIVGGARLALSDMQMILESLVTKGFATDKLLEHRTGLEAAAADAESWFKRLRRAGEAEFRSDLSEVVERSLAGNADQIEEGGIDVRIDLQGVPLCGADAEELAFVVDNLVENAVRAMRGSPTRLLEVGWLGGDGRVVLVIKDTGCGIPPDDMDRIFNAGQGGRAQGGLGLPRSNDLLSKFDGSVQVASSRPAMGTTMKVYLRSADPD